TDCAVGHTPEAWVPATFNHDLAGFKLLGKHADVACEDCHINEVYEGTPTDCFSCHEKDDKHDGRFGTDCALCHSPDGWLPADFDHNLAAFKLEGKHQSVDCEACHINDVYQGTPQDCYSCHKQDDEHRGRYGTDCSQCHTAQGWEPANVNHAGFTVGCATCHAQDDAHNGQYGTDCSACHSTNAWKPASFDHSISGFPLTGAHVRADCTQCHTGNTFSGLSTACVACHADPAFHSGALGTNCASCHNTSAWVPAGYNRSHPFIADEGGSGINHGGASCRTCHPSTVYNYTCLACHSNNSGGEGGGDD
ncbi:MAG: hypothetical protein L3J16_06255, partial [Anaerolineales bacterium]|nr:hypothetical protein [Anaerolineales bacterium]